jgi:hypothetical protein
MGLVREQALLAAAQEAIEPGRQDEMVSVQVKPIAGRAKPDE